MTAEDETDLEHQWERRAYWRQRAETAEAALREIKNMIPVQHNGKADSYDGTANPTILLIVDSAIEEKT